MSYNKNTAGQKFNVLAVNSGTGLPVTGDAANITAQISKDFGAFVSLTDTNPTELDSTNAPGVYVFDLSQAETNADVLTIVPTSTTANVEMDMLNIYTVIVDDYKADTSALATSAQITALNDFDPATDVVANVTLVDTVTTNTDMRGTDGANTIAPANSDIAAIKTTTDQFVFTVANQVDANSLTGGLTQSEVADAVLTGGDIDGYSLEEALKICAAALAGKVSGAGTNTVTFRAADDSKDRIVATVTGQGNRLSVTIDTTG